jgi:hypothetical protein
VLRAFGGVKEPDGDEELALGAGLAILYVDVDVRHMVCPGLAFLGRLAEALHRFETLQSSETQCGHVQHAIGTEDLLAQFVAQIRGRHVRHMAVSRQELVN